MKTAPLIILFVIFSNVSLALELEHQQLIGQWLVTETDGRDTKADNEVWEFNKNTIYIRINGIAEATEAYNILADTIYSGYVKIKVIEITPESMEVKMDNSILKLKKVN